jgi:predicted aldo/keto reductase-like oxidoreductase
MEFLLNTGINHIDTAIDYGDSELLIGPRGALEFFKEAQAEGTARNLGVTGHGLTVTAMHRRSLEQHRFDAILLPGNYTLSKNPDYRSEFLQLREYCRNHNVAVQTIKSIAKGPVNGDERPRDVWYEPFPGEEPSTDTMEEMARRTGQTPLFTE